MNEMQVNDNKDILQVIDNFSSLKILVIGDFILDVYLQGKSSRLCPDAPVPVVDITDEKIIEGGAANTVCNLTALGAQVIFCSVVGMDEEGEMAKKIIHSKITEASSVIQCHSRDTLSKTRVISGHQLITRFDKGSTHSLDEETESKLFEKIESAYHWCDAVIISDYDKGVITGNTVEKLKPLQNQTKKPIAIDSKRLGFFKTLNPLVVKPNYQETIDLLQISKGDKRPDQIKIYGRQLFEKTGAHFVVVTLDEEGSLLFENGKFSHHEPALQVSNPQVSGAGDTYLSTILLSFLSGETMQESMEVASIATAIAIAKPFTASCNKLELLQKVALNSKIVNSFNTIQSLSDFYHLEGKTIVFTNGCFDILHSGHVSYLHCAKKLGDILIVGINNDESIKRLKGQSRPVNTLVDRIQVLAALSAVDFIIPFGAPHDDTPIELIKLIKPDVFAKGGDYSLEKLPEAETVKQYGGQIVFLPLVPDHSTTNIISKIHQEQILKVG